MYVLRVTFIIRQVFLENVLLLMGIKLLVNKYVLLDCHDFPLLNVLLAVYLAVKELN